jgi:hypothetical protein
VVLPPVPQVGTFAAGLVAVSGGAAATVQLLYVISGHLWGVAGLFFGLCLIPMGWLAWILA